MNAKGETDMSPIEFSCIYLEDISSLGICFGDIICRHNGKSYTAMDLDVVCAKSSIFRDAVSVTLHRLLAQDAGKENTLSILGIFMAEAITQGIY